MRVFFYVFFVLIIGPQLITSCNKNKKLEFVLQGKVFDKSFNAPLVGATVSLKEVYIGYTGEEVIHTTTLDSQGSFELKFSREKAIKYLLTISKDNYFTISKEISFDKFSTEKPLVLELETTAKAWLKLVFINSSPSSNADKFSYIKQQGKQDCQECCPISEQIFYGTDTNEVFCVNDGNSIYSYFYFATNPSDANLKEIYTPAFDTLVHIQYW